MPRRTILPSAVLLAICLTAASSADDWRAWRGPLGTGQSNETHLPSDWSAEKNIVWKVPLDGPGNSSPIVVGDKVLITHAPEKSNLRGLRCYDRQSGKLLWKHEVAYAEKEPSHHTNPYCSASSVSDGERVVAWYGSAGLYCYDLDGKILWQRDLGKVEHIWGYGSSPALFENLVLLNFGPGLNAFVAAFDKATGEEVWRKTFPEQTSLKIEEFRGSWSTPVILPQGDQPLALLSLPDRLFAVDPRTGEERWSCAGLSKLIYTSPVVTDDAVVAMSGYGGPAIAVKTGGSGDVTETHRLWRHEGNPQRVGSGVIVGEHLFILNEPGIAWCLEVASGKKLWEERLPGGNSWSSMAYADGRLYISNTAGTTFVLEPSTTECKIIAQNDLDELTRASPAFSGGQIVLRTYKHLYCIGNPR